MRNILKGGVKVNGRQRGHRASIHLNDGLHVVRVLYWKLLAWRTT